MLTIKEEGIVLNTYPSGEADLVVHTLLRESGKVSFIAKHAKKSRKRFIGGLDVFDCGVFEYKKGKGELEILLSLIPKGGLDGLRRDMGKFTGGTLLCEAFDLLLSPGRVNEKPYALLRLSLEALEEASTKEEMHHVLTLTLNELLSLSGFGDKEGGAVLGPLLHQVELQSGRALQCRKAIKDYLLP